MTDETEASSKDVARLTHSARRINQLARGVGAKFYLEIGVQAGMTFNQVDIEDRTAVDPKFCFSYSHLESERIRFHEITSDSFMLNYGPDSRKYDIIFLDGLHEAHQTFRDFCSTQALSHPGTIWIIDDTIPVDVFSSHPDQELALRAREMHGRKSSRAWHGDVFKVVPCIDFLFLNFKFCTLAGEGNPQTVFWQGLRGGRSFDFQSIEEIMRMTWFDFISVKDKFGLRRDESAALQEIVSDVTRHR